MADQRHAAQPAPKGTSLPPLIEGAGGALASPPRTTRARLEALTDELADLVADLLLDGRLEGTTSPEPRPRPGRQ